MPAIVGSDTLYCMQRERLSLISNKLVELQFNVDSLSVANTQIPLYISIIDKKEQQLSAIRRINKGYAKSIDNLSIIIKNKDIALADTKQVMDFYIDEVKRLNKSNAKQKRKHRTVTAILLGAVTAFATTTLIFSLN